jgi:hypothetical protein
MLNTASAEADPIHLGTQEHAADTYTYEQIGLHVFQRKNGGPAVWFCSSAAWENSLHKVVNR